MNLVTGATGQHAIRPCLYVRDPDTAEWHVVNDFGMVAPLKSWALCGRWPSRSSGWTEVHAKRAGLSIHDVCRYWAGIGGPWLYVGVCGQVDWHVIHDSGDDRGAHVPALC